MRQILPFNNSKTRLILVKSGTVSKVRVSFLSWKIFCLIFIKSDYFPGLRFEGNIIKDLSNL